MTLSVTHIPDPRGTSLIENTRTLLPVVGEPINPFKDIYGLFTTLPDVNLKGVCMFSGHMALMGLLVLYWASLPLHPKKHDNRIKDVLSWFTGIMAIMETWIILAARINYSMDMIVAIYVAVGVWYTFDYWWKHRIASGKRACLHQLRTSYYEPIVK